MVPSFSQCDNLIRYLTTKKDMNVFERRIKEKQREEVKQENGKRLSENWGRGIQDSP
jgi:galactose-1-phosphate uridylyltransferase